MYVQVITLFVIKQPDPKSPANLTDKILVLHIVKSSLSLSFYHFVHMFHQFVGFPVRKIDAICHFVHNFIVWVYPKSHIPQHIYKAAVLGRHDVKHHHESSNESRKTMFKMIYNGIHLFIFMFLEITL